MQARTAQVRDSLDAALDRSVARATGFGDLATDPAFWFGIAAQVGRVAVILFLAVVILSLVGRVRGRWLRHVEGLPALDPRRQRTLTLSDLAGSSARYAVWLVAGVMVLAELGLDIGPLLASAGVAGLAIGFGAQTLVKDVISGFFLLFDNTIRVGDLVRVGDRTGTVEDIGLRLIRLREFNGEVLMVPAGELRTFGNQSMGFMRVIVPVGLSYEQDVDEALSALERIAREWAEIPENRAVMLDEHPEVQAVMDLGDSAVTARIIVQVRPGEQFRAERDLRRLIKKRFDEGGVEIPFPRRTVYVRRDPSESSGEDETPEDIFTGES